MLDPKIYKLMEVKVLTYRDMIINPREDDIDQILLESYFNEKIKEIEKDGYIVEPGTMTMEFIEQYQRGSLIMLYSMQLMLYKEHKQLDEEKEKIEYLKTIPIYNELLTLVKTVSSIEHDMYIADNKAAVLYHDLADRILSGFEKAEKEYGYKSNEYRVELAKVYDICKQELDRLNEKYNK